MREAEWGGLRLTGSGLAAARGGRSVFAGLAFEVASGELLAVTGPNGAGKSTLLRLVAGLVRPAAGQIALAPAREEEPGTACHYLGHLDALKPASTVAANLAFWQRIWGAGDVATALARVGLAHAAHLPAAFLSAGQRRRAAVARLLLAPRPVWLLDEPTAALDTAGEAMLGELVAAHLAKGGIAIAATHRDLPVPPARTLRLGRPA